MKRLRIEVCVLLGTAVFLVIAFALPGGREQLDDVHDAMRTVAPTLDAPRVPPR